MDKPFLTDIQELRRRARSHIKKGAVTEGYQADRKTMLRLLNEALAGEIICEGGEEAQASRRHGAQQGAPVRGADTSPAI